MAGMNVVGVFSDKQHLASAMRDLETADFDRNDMRVVNQEKTQNADGLLDEIRDLGAPDEDARMYLQKVQHGAQLLNVETDEDRADQAAGIIERYERGGTGGTDDVVIVGVTTITTENGAGAQAERARARSVRSYPRL